MEKYRFEIIKPQFREQYKTMYEWQKNQKQNDSEKNIKKTYQNFFKMVDENNTFVDEFSTKRIIEEEIISTEKMIPLKQKFPTEITLLILDISGIKPLSKFQYQYIIKSNILYKFKIDLYQLVKKAISEQNFRDFAFQWLEKLKTQKIDEIYLKIIKFICLTILIVSEESLWDEEKQGRFRNLQVVLFKNRVIQGNELMSDILYYSNPDFVDVTKSRYSFISQFGKVSDTKINFVSLIPTWSQSFLEFLFILNIYDKFDENKIQQYSQNTSQLNNITKQLWFTTELNALQQHLALMQICGYRKSEDIKKIQCFKDVQNYTSQSEISESQQMFNEYKLFQSYKLNVNIDEMDVYLNKDEQNKDKYFIYWPVDPEIFDESSQSSESYDNEQDSENQSENEENNSENQEYYDEEEKEREDEQNKKKDQSTTEGQIEINQRKKIDYLNEEDKIKQSNEQQTEQNKSEEEQVQNSVQKQKEGIN